MTEKEKLDFYESIPPFMHHFPYVFVWQQRYFIIIILYYYYIIVFLIIN